MRIKIIAKPIDKSNVVFSEGVKVINIDTGEEIENIRQVNWGCRAGSLAIAIIEFIGVECEIEGEAVIETTKPGDEIKSFKRLKANYSSSHSQCTACNGTGKIMGFLKEYDCEECKKEINNV